MKAGDIQIRKCTHPWAHQTEPSRFDVLAVGETIADAIRNTGIRCETCEHWNWHSYDKSYGGRCSELHTDFMPDNGGGFCSQHSELK